MKRQSSADSTDSKTPATQRCVRIDHKLKIRLQAVVAVCLLGLPFNLVTLVIKINMKLNSPLTSQEYITVGFDFEL